MRLSLLCIRMSACPIGTLYSIGIALRVLNRPIIKLISFFLSMLSFYFKFLISLSLIKLVAFVAETQCCHFILISDFFACHRQNIVAETQCFALSPRVRGFLWCLSRESETKVPLFYLMLMFILFLI